MDMMLRWLHKGARRWSGRRGAPEAPPLFQRVDTADLGRDGFRASAWLTVPGVEESGFAETMPACTLMWPGCSADAAEAACRLCA